MATLRRKDLFCYSSSAQAIVVRIRGCRGLKQLLTLGSHSVHIMNVHCPFTSHFLGVYSLGAAKGQCQAQWAGLLTSVTTIKANPHKRVSPSPKRCQVCPVLTVGGLCSPSPPKSFLPPRKHLLIVQCQQLEKGSKALG